MGEKWWNGGGSGVNGVKKRFVGYVWLTNLNI